MKKGSFEKFRLTEDSLKMIKEAVSSNDNSVNSAWLSLIGKSWYVDKQTEPQSVENSIASSSENANDNNFFFTQAVNRVTKPLSIDTTLSVDDAIACTCEALEQPNERLDFLNLKKFSVEELSKIFEALKEKLSENGVFNLCCSVDNMSIEQSLTFLPTMFSKFLLPKVIELESFSLKIRKAIQDCALKFPSEFQNYVLNEIFNSDPKNTRIFLKLLEDLQIEKDSSFLIEFANHTRELKEWHFTILEKCLIIKIDENSKNKLLKLFLNKATTFGDNKKYGALVLSFAKTNVPFTNEEKLVLGEIATLNQTVYKKIIEKYSRN